MVWMQVNVPLPTSGSDKYAEIFDAFEAAFMAALAPKGVAMFERNPKPGECIFYFSPAAVVQFPSWLASVSASESEEPPRAGTTLLIGHADSLDMLR